VSDVVLVDRYELLDRIGSGAMAVVWRGLDRRLGREIAVKILSESLVSDERFRLRFEREARHIASLSHPNIVVVHDFGADDNRLFIVMELVHGRALSQLIEERSRCSASFASDVAKDVLSGLAHAHESGILHRDIKPGNILVSEEGTSKLADFGIARATGETVTLTDSGSLLGTVAYSSPEQIAGRDLGLPSDLYSVACVLYECLSGHPPFVGTNIADLVAEQQFEAPTPLGELVPDAPHTLCDTVMRALEKDPASRFASALEMKEALTGITRRGASAGSGGPAVRHSTTVTVLFCDQVGSTALQSALGDDSADELRRGLLASLRSSVRTHNGEVVKMLGDGLMAVFRHSVIDALRCATDIVEDPERLAQGLSMRVGLSNGEVTSEEGDFFGTPVVEASRLESAAEPGTVLVASVIRTIVGSRGPFAFDEVSPLELKGLPGPVQAFRVTKASGTTTGAEPNKLNPLPPRPDPTSSSEHTGNGRVRLKTHPTRALRHRFLVFALAFILLIGGGIVIALTTSSRPTSSSKQAPRIPSVRTSPRSGGPLLMATDLDRWKWTYSPLPTYDELLDRSWYGGSPPLPANLQDSSPTQSCVATAGANDPTPVTSSFVSYAPAEVIPTPESWLTLSEHVSYFTTEEEASQFQTYQEQEGRYCSNKFALPAGLSSANSCPDQSVTQLLSDCRVASDWHGRLDPIPAPPSHLCESAPAFSAPTGAAGLKGAFYVSFIRCGSAVSELDVLAGTKSGFGQRQMMLFAGLVSERLRARLNKGEQVPVHAPSTDEVNGVNNVVFASMGAGWKNNGLQQWWLNASPQAASGWDLTSCDQAHRAVYRTYEEGNMALYSSAGQMVRSSDKHAAISTNTLYFSNLDYADNSFVGYNAYRGTCPSNLVQSWNPNPAAVTYDPLRVKDISIGVDQSFNDLRLSNQCGMQNQCQVTVNDLRFQYSEESSSGGHGSHTGVEIYWLIGIVQYGDFLVQLVESNDGAPPNKSQFHSLLKSQMSAMRAIES
jgi:class 3 adenylate cyclase